jgi:hypothetical protein
MAYNPNNPNGQASAANSAPVVLDTTDSGFLSQIASGNLPDLYLTGAAAQTAVVNNILPGTSGTAALDATGYRSATVQIVSTGTSGTFIFEGSNDNTNFQAIPVYSQLILTGTPITAAITATASQLIYTFPVSMRYIRLRIATTIGGGSIQAFTRLETMSWTPAVFQVAQATAANLNMTLASTTITSSAGSAAATTDIASAAITATTTSATVAMTNIQTASFGVTVTAVSGTNETLDIVVQESIDNTNWYDIYHFERITAAGFWVSPAIGLTGQSIRYVRTVGGTTPSFTMSLVRESRQITAPLVRRIFDRVINLNTAASTTASMYTDGCDEVQIVLSSGAGATSAPVLTLQGSEDNSNWFQLSPTPITVTGTASTNSANNTVIGILPKFVRAIVSTTGVAATYNYVCLKARGT